MDNKYHEKLIVSSAPHAVGPVSTQKIMGLVLVALVVGMGAYIYGTAVFEPTYQTSVTYVTYSSNSSTPCSLACRFSYTYLVETPIGGFAITI